MNEKSDKAIEYLLDKAADCKTADEAMKYSQAVLNLTNAARCRKEVAGAKWQKKDD